MTACRIGIRKLLATLLVCAVGGIAGDGCSAAEGHPSTAHDHRRDAGSADAKVRSTGASEHSRPTGKHSDSSELYPHDLIGLTKQQLERRHGLPTEKRADRWTYRLKQMGCSDVDLSEVFTFKDGRVSNMTLQRRQNGRNCDDFQ